MKTQILTVSSKGQISLPSNIRRKLSIETGDKLALYVSEDIIMLKVLRLPTAEEFEASLDDARTYLVTTLRSRSGFEFGMQMSESMSESMSELMSELEVERMKTILSYLSENYEINGTKAATILNVEPKTARRLLNKACEAGILECEGRTRGKVYREAN